MKFEVGKTYRVGGAGYVKIEKRTSCYVTVSGSYTGRRLIREWPTGGEIILIPITKRVDCFCFSWKTKRYRVYANENLAGINCKFWTDNKTEINAKGYGNVAIISISGTDPEGVIKKQISDGLFKSIKVEKVEEIS